MWKGEDVLSPFFFFFFFFPFPLKQCMILISICPLRLCDEATSALDSTTESEILNALKTLANNRTSIFIAHRLTTAMQCDEVTIIVVTMLDFVNFPRGYFICTTLHLLQVFFFISIMFYLLSAPCPLPQPVFFIFIVANFKLVLFS